MNRIREIRKEKGLTAKYLALKLGIAESTVSQYENAKREPDQNTLIQIADLLGVSLDYLLCRSEQNDVKKQPPAVGEELEKDRLIDELESDLKSVLVKHGLLIADDLPETDADFLIHVISLIDAYFKKGV